MMPAQKAWNREWDRRFLGSGARDTMAAKEYESCSSPQISPYAYGEKPKSTEEAKAQLTEMLSENLVRERDNLPQGYADWHASEIAFGKKENLSE